MIATIWVEIKDRSRRRRRDICYVPHGPCASWPRRQNDAVHTDSRRSISLARAIRWSISTQATIILGFLNVVGWGLGLLESILIVIVVGFSVDYTVHLADSYMGSSSTNREGKVATREGLGLAEASGTGSDQGQAISSPSPARSKAQAALRLRPGTGSG